MDGVCVPDILFGLDFVVAMRAATETPLDVHLMTRTNVELVDRAVDAGATRLAVHASFCADVRAILRRIEERGTTSVLVVPLDLEIDAGSLPWGFFRRVLLMGTQIGIKGVGLDPSIPARIRALTELRATFRLNFEIFVDGGIRPDTAPILAAAGADGIVPGSLVFEAPDPVATIRWIHSLQRSPGEDISYSLPSAGPIASRKPASESGPLLKQPAEERLGSPTTLVRSVAQSNRPIDKP